MPGIVFYFEENDKDVWSGRDIDLEAWASACQAAGDITKVIIINQTNTKLRTFDPDKNFKITDKLPDNLEGHITYVICPWDKAQNKQSLWDFDHQTDWYIFGPSVGWCNHPIQNGIYIPVPDNKRIALHATHIASVVLMHRFGRRQWL